MDDKEKMGELAAQMWEDPDLHPLMAKWVEEKAPGTHARVSAQKTIEAGTAAIKQEIETAKKELAEERATRTREREIERIKADPTLHITDEDIPKIVETAKARGLGTWEDAAHTYRRLNPIAAPRATSNYSMEVPGLDGSEGTKWLEPAMRNLGDKSILDRVTNRQVDEIRRQVAAGLIKD